jgi:hypothetical protein
MMLQTLSRLLCAQRLAALCEAALADSLLSGGEDEFAADLAPQLLMLADAVSLPHLRSVALHFVNLPPPFFAL